MKRFFAVMLLSTLSLGACTEFEGVETPPGSILVREVPESVAALAAPQQDLSTVIVNEADGCFLYRYTGPVETTFLPLRSKEGRPICSKPS